MQVKFASWMTVIFIALAPIPANAQTDAAATGVAPSSDTAATPAAAVSRREFRRDRVRDRRQFAQDRRLKRRDHRRDVRKRSIRPNGGPGRARVNPARIRNFKATQKQRRRRAAANR